MEQDAKNGVTTSHEAQLRTTISESENAAPVPLNYKNDLKTGTELPQQKAYLEQRSQKLKVLLKSNEEILRKLEEVRQTKAYEMMKFKRIQNMHASKVGEYLRSELRQPTPVKMSEVEQIRQKLKERIENNAATVIQRHFRQLLLRKKIQDRTQRWNVGNPKQRLELIEEVSSRLSENKAPCRPDLSVIKLRLKEWRDYRPASVRTFEKREALMRRLEHGLHFLKIFDSK